MMNELKPCPWCGRTGNIIAETVQLVDIIYQGIKEQTGVENAEFYKHTVIDLLDEVGKK